MDITVSIQLDKSLTDKQARTVTGWAAVVTRDDGQPVIDSDDHIIPVQVLKRAVQDAFAEESGAGKVGINHEQRGMADLVESFVVTKENRKALGLGESGREGWIATLRITDPDVIKRIDSGELTELSLSGTATGEWT